MPVETNGCGSNQTIGLSWGLTRSATTVYWLNNNNINTITFSNNSNLIKYNSTATNLKGFNGKEKDDETSLQDYGMRIYDSRLGRFLSTDPSAPSYPWYTPYQFAGNKPVWCIDLDGLEEKIVTIAKDGSKTVLKMSDFSLIEWRSIQTAFFTGFSHSKTTQNGFNWSNGYEQYTLGMGSSVTNKNGYVGPGKGTLTFTLDATGSVATVNYDSKDVKSIAGPKPIPMATSAKEGIKATWDLFFAPTQDDQIKAMRSDFKKIPVFIGIALSGGTFGGIVGGTAGVTEATLAVVDLGFSIDDLTADANGQTFMTSKLTSEQGAVYSSLKAAFGVYTKMNSTIEWGKDPESMQKFANWVNENYKMVDGVLQAVESVKEAKQDN